jgi:acyl-CoA thioester hydrolase/thioesterase-3
MDIVVRSTEIDVNGHVNNAKYLEYLEWGREDWYEQHGLDYNTLKAANIVTVVVHVSADYRREAVQNDRLTITSWLERVGNTSFVMKQTIHNQHGDLVLEAEFVIVTVDPVSRQKVRVPDAIRRHALEP